MYWKLHFYVSHTKVWLLAELSRIFPNFQGEKMYTTVKPTSELTIFVTFAKNEFIISRLCQVFLNM